MVSPSIHPPPPRTLLTPLSRAQVLQTPRQRHGRGEAGRGLPAAAGRADNGLLHRRSRKRALRRSLLFPTTPQCPMAPPTPCSFSPPVPPPTLLSRTDPSSPRSRRPAPAGLSSAQAPALRPVPCRLPPSPGPDRPRAASP